ncbi:hypothetical protein SDRG_00893 [Saprolegnia diclina VS20]|uniref:EF-hand domain-containing protein n=1 Tax=Saprolegnia diclina (strain VS20) TaxID=1156394 RepID=T0R6H3_SAPDV|nr:hypothetical protein SDRG_00893 [Saprolegnia diclina VS20]EQC42050.1 hypothetical protein SDRG_00893 [Saprolegnia diclina VS20]|eukprot:XP_008604619.1 hypothetical protein SDRG_00893 [Saprolegnia diclina VS20]
MVAPPVSEAFPSDVLFHAGLEYSVRGTIYAFMATVLFVVVFRYGLKLLEGRTASHAKYFVLLNKMYKELMVGGLIQFSSNRLSQFGAVEQDSPAYQAWEVADDMVFFFAIALALQSALMFWRLQARNVALDTLALYTSEELYAEATNNGALATIPKPYVSASKLCIVRHFFLTKHKLPQLFSYPKYLRAVQDTEIIELFDVEVSTWILLLLVYSGLFFLSDVFVSYHDDLNLPETRKKVHDIRLIVIAVAIAALTVFMLVMYAYLKNVVYRMVLHAGGDEATLAASLKRVGDEEASSRIQETSSHALLKMHHVAEGLSDRHDRSSIGDLVLTIFRKVTGCKYKTASHRQASQLMDEHAMDLPWFSRKATHVGVKVLLTLNALYFGFLAQALIVLIPRDVGASHYILGGLLAYLIVAHMVLLAPRIARQLAFINATVRVNPAELKIVIEHYADVLQLQRKMARAVLAHLAARDVTIDVFIAGLKLDDPNETGYMEGAVLRKNIKRFGYKFSKLKFTSFVRLQFETKGTKVKYERLVQMLHDEAAHHGDEALPLAFSDVPPMSDKKTPLLSPRHVTKQVD